MQTKSSLVKIAGMVGVALAILALLLSAKILHRAHSSQIVASQSWRRRRQLCSTTLQCAEGRLDAPVRRSCRSGSRPIKDRRRRKFATWRTARATNYF